MNSEHEGVLWRMATLDSESRHRWLESGLETYSLGALLQCPVWNLSCPFVMASTTLPATGSHEYPCGVESSVVQNRQRRGSRACLENAQSKSILWSDSMSCLGSLLLRNMAVNRYILCCYRMWNRVAGKTVSFPCHDSAMTPWAAFKPLSLWLFVMAVIENYYRCLLKI